MGRQLTTIDIKGTLFEVDACREALLEKGNPRNRIPFQVFDQEGDGYRFLYDTLLKNVPASKAAVLEEPERYCWVTVQALMELDPEGIALRYDIPLEILCPDRQIIPLALTATVRPVRLPSSR